ncbi:UNVERIFIED_CONTAM: hypothetical protein GTU68_066635 [Idotea baltica]|nr:hypothetical protein [Idotea baltica]
MLKIDGSEGEGGGQIIRSSMALSVLSNTPIHITNIRAGRKKPGLKRQHVTSVQAVADVCGGTATLTGATLESSELMFEPGQAHAGSYYFNIGSAGSATLVLQTVLPVLLLADGPSTVVIEGGTHNDMAPPFDFLDRCFLPFVRSMGATIDLTLERHGFFPAGGGKIVAHINPPELLAGFDVHTRGQATSRSARALLSKLPDHIGERQLKTVARLLRWPSSHTDSIIERVHSDGPGTVCWVELGFDNVHEIVSGVGRRGLTSEKLAKNIAKETQQYLDHGAPIGEHLADQLLMPLALSRGGSFRTGPLSMHTTTHIDIIARFLPVSIDVAANDDQTCTINVRPNA